MDKFDGRVAFEWDRSCDRAPLGRLANPRDAEVIAINAEDRTPSPS